MMERDPQLTIQGAPVDGERLLEHHAWLQGLAEDLARDAPDADDAVQETFLAALTCRDGPRRHVPWLKAVLRNCVRQSHRARLRRRRREERAARREGIAAPVDLHLEREELQAELEGQVARLAEPYRSTVLLHYFDELSLEEIARRQGLPSATVRTRLRRALAELRRRRPSRERPPLRRSVSSRMRGAGAALFLTAFRPRGAAAATSGASVRAGARSGSVNVSSSLSFGGVMQIGVKSVTLASVVSVALFGTVSGLYLLGRGTGENDSRPASSPESPLVKGSESTAGATATAPLLAANLPGASPAPDGKSSAPDETVGPAAKLERVDSDVGEPADEAVLALRRDYGELRRLFEGTRGWKLVGENIVKIREAITQSEEGFEEFLALIDDEKDNLFLEALLHHLPLKSDSPFQKEIVADEDLHEELWARFAAETDPYRQRSFLRFFCYQPTLSAKKMAAFGEIARSDAPQLVRSISMDAISSSNFPKETWPALCEVAEHDADESLRALAVRGLAGADSERAREIYRAAFRSESEAMRAAAVSAREGESPPVEAIGGDFTSYLVGELRGASSLKYRQALIDRLLDVAPLTLLHEADRALRTETDRQVKRQYREAIESARARVERRAG